jgi:tetratricopeptide (TPR) repeat protein
LEQYRHATVSSEPYWREALRHDGGDARNNLMLGRLLLRRGDFITAEGHLRQAIKRLTRWNFNPYDGEAYYLLGLVLRYQGRLEEAYASFYKAIWNYAWQSSGYYALAEIDCMRGNYSLALENLDLSLQTNLPHLKGRSLKAALLRRLGKHELAASTLEDTLKLDRLDFWSLNELVLVNQAQGKTQAFDKYNLQLQELIGEDIQTVLDIAFDYAAAGLFNDATEWLMRLAVTPEHIRYPMVYYALGFFAQQQGENEKAHAYYQKASQIPPDYCFPFRLEEMLILQQALEVDPNDSRAAYYLGNLLYDKDRHDEAVSLWETSCQLDPSFAIPWRNLGLAAYNHGRDLEKSLTYYQKAYEVNPRDPRLLFELDQMMKRARIPPKERLNLFEAHKELVFQRDDLTLELATLYNRCGRPVKALEVLLNHPLHPWEGGEGLVSGQFTFSHLVLGRESLEAGNAADAVKHFEEALDLPEQLGEARYLPSDASISYHLGLAHDALHLPEKAAEFYRNAVDTLSNYPTERYYRALAQRRLGDEVAAQTLLQTLQDDARKMVEEDDPYTFFYAHMPSALFIDDLGELKWLESRFLMGLLHLALEQYGEARLAFEKVLEKDPSHQGAWEEYRRLT